MGTQLPSGGERGTPGSVPGAMPPHPPARATLNGQVQHPGDPRQTDTQTGASTPGDPRQTDTQTSASTPRDPRHTHSLFLKVRRGLVALLKGPRAPVHPRPSLLGLRCHPPALRGKDVLQGLAGPCIPHRRGSPLSPTPDPRGQDSSPVPSQESWVLSPVPLSPCPCPGPEEAG